MELNLQPKVVPLTSGLDLISPKLLVQPGSLLDSKNVELVDVAGYKRVDGIQKWSGRDYPESTTGYVYTCLDTPSPITFTPGVMTVDVSLGTFDAFVSTVIYVVSAENVPEEVGDDFTIPPYTKLVLLEPLGANEVSITNGVDTMVFSLARDREGVSLAQYNVIEAGINAATPATLWPALGLHTFNDTDYAVVPCTRVIAYDEDYSNLTSVTSPAIGATLTSTGGAEGTIVGRGRDSVGSTWYVFYDVIWDGTGSWVGTTNGTTTTPAGTPVIASSNDVIESPTRARIYKTNNNAWELVALDTATTTLPGRSQLTTANSRYQFHTHNFFGNSGLEAMYGVCGSGYAWSLDAGGTFAFITSAPINPRHVAEHHQHLVLGYNDGTVAVSVVGDPSDFDTVNGAFQLYIGDRITGLMSLSGTVMAIFCSKQVWGLAGTTVDSFTTQILSANTGCIEYTAVDCGMPVYCDARGISVLEQSDTYGDFLGTRLSTIISPWLLPRAGNITMAYPCRTKNQYRLHFKDGTVLTMTLMGAQRTPGFTFQKYEMDVDNNPLIPYAVSSELLANGKERILASHYSAESEFYSKHVYIMDAGFGFAGRKVDWYATTNWFFENPAMFEKIKKIRLHGLSKGVASMVVSAAGIDTDYPTSRFPTSKEVISLPRTPSNLTTEYLPYTNIANEVPSRGYAIQLRFEDNPDDTTIEPPLFLQVMVVSNEQGGKLDG